nr:DNA-directed RNA polymerase subunit K [Sulfodiicoccus acidiphilus]
MEFKNFYINVWKDSLTRYERARIIGARALQISMGAVPLIDVESLPSKDLLSIAEAELDRGVLPITVRRRLPGGTYVLLSLRKKMD